MSTLNFAIMSLRVVLTFVCRFMTNSSTSPCLCSAFSLASFIDATMTAILCWASTAAAVSSPDLTSSSVSVFFAASISVPTRTSWTAICPVTCWETRASSLVSNSVIAAAMSVCTSSVEATAASSVRVDNGA